MRRTVSAAASGVCPAMSWSQIRDSMPVAERMARRGRGRRGVGGAPQRLERVLDPPRRPSAGQRRAPTRIGFGCGWFQRQPQRRAQLGFPLDVVGGEGRHERIEARPDLGRRVVAEQCLGLICGCAATRRLRWFGK